MSDFYNFSALLKTQKSLKLLRVSDFVKTSSIAHPTEELLTRFKFEQGNSNKRVVGNDTTVRIVCRLSKVTD